MIFATLMCKAECSQNHTTTATQSDSQISDDKWLSTAEERQYLYLICGVVVIFLSFICCISAIFCYHDKNKTRRMEIELELEKMRGAPLEKKTSASAAMDTPHSEQLSDATFNTNNIGGMSNGNGQRSRKLSNATNISRSINHHRVSSPNNGNLSIVSSPNNVMMDNNNHNHKQQQQLFFDQYLKTKQQQQQKKRQNHSHFRSQSEGLRRMHDVIIKMDVVNNAAEYSQRKDTKRMKKQRNDAKQKKIAVMQKNISLDLPESEDLLSSDNDNESLYVASPKGDFIE